MKNIQNYRKELKEVMCLPIDGGTNVSLYRALVHAVERLTRRGHAGEPMSDFPANLRPRHQTNKLYNVWLEMNSVRNEEDDDEQLVTRFRIASFTTKEEASRIFRTAINLALES